jgi:excisionase family DNA binding protein
MSAPPVEPMFLRPAEAAALACLSTRAIYRAIDRGELRAVRLCSRLRIPREGFEAWIASSTVRVEHRIAPPPPPAPPPVRGSFRQLFDGGGSAS